MDLVFKAGWPPGRARTARRGRAPLRETKHGGTQLMIDQSLEETLCKVESAVDRVFSELQVPWLTKLVAQSSHTPARADVEAALAIVDAAAEHLQMHCTRAGDPESVFADHRLYATPATGQDDQALALVGHCDTVHPRESGFAGCHIDPPDSPSGGDHVRGPGVLDMKSGLSVILFGLRALSQAAPDVFSRLKLRFICNSDEEVGSPTSRSLLENVAAKTTHALVFEYGREGDRIITARKGTAGYRLRATGRSAHAGNQHEDGVSAIHALALVIPAIEDLTKYERGTTVNVGTIHGGSARNTVPAAAECSIDVRTTTPSEAQRVDRAIRELARQPFTVVDRVPQKLRQVQFAIDGGIRRPPMQATARSQQLRHRYEQHARRQGLGVGEAPLQGGGSDANLLAAAGTACIDGLGPIGGGAHTSDEWASLDSLRRRTRALASFLVAYGR